MAEIAISYTHPLYLGPSDTPGIVLIPVKLTGSENYGLWSRTMKIALLGKRKLGFVTGTCSKESLSTELLSGNAYASNAHLVWEDLREWFDKVNPMRIFQIHRAIATLSQGTDSVSTYFTKLKSLWNEHEAMVPASNSRESAEHLQQQRLLQFLSGLNDSYDQVRRQILLQSNEPSLNQAYAMVIEDESQHSSSGLNEKNDLMAMQVGRGQGYRGKKPFM
ncbi:uncharacterized protein [Nicotiana tomentosiformis]|uniref:uncharacterized protein n=1 Tax=Nicotiana tomentosiformis TaxID=4098 RepID=UPI00388CE3E8